MKRIIVGFDPGTTVGIGIVDLSGNIVFFSSFRNFSFEDVVRAISERGNPVIFASDVSPAPNSIKKLAAAFDAEIFEPELSLTVSEKTRLVRGKGTKDAHQRDALAAAFKAEESYRSLLRRAKKVGSRWELAFELALKGKAPNLSKVFEEKVEKGEEKFSLPLKLRLKIAMRENKRLRLVVKALTEGLEKSKRVWTRNSRNGVHTIKPRSGELKSVLKRAEAAERVEEGIERILRHFEGTDVRIIKSGVIGDVVFVPVFGRGAEAVLKAKVVIAGKILKKSSKFDVVSLGGLDGLSFEDFAIIPVNKFPKAGKGWLKRIVGTYKDRKKTG